VSPALRGLYGWGLGGYMADVAIGVFWCLLVSFGVATSQGCRQSFNFTKTNHLGEVVVRGLSSGGYNTFGCMLGKAA